MIFFPGVNNAFCPPHVPLVIVLLQRPRQIKVCLFLFWLFTHLPYSTFTLFTAADNSKKSLPGNLFHFSPLLGKEGHAALGCAGCSKLSYAVALQEKYATLSSILQIKCWHLTLPVSPAFLWATSAFLSPNHVHCMHQVGLTICQTPFTERDLVVSGTTTKV